MTIAERLEKFSIPEPNSGCLLWIGGATTAGYGIIHEGRTTRYVHRAAWENGRGPIPPGLYVCHKCDTKCCINVRHLFLGSAKDNADDMVRKGQGEHLWLNRKLNPKKVREVWRLLGLGLTQEEIGRRLGVHQVTIYDIKSGNSWRAYRPATS